MHSQQYDKHTDKVCSLKSIDRNSRSSFSSRDTFQSVRPVEIEAAGLMETRANSFPVVVKIIDTIDLVIIVAWAASGAVLAAILYLITKGVL